MNIPTEQVLAEPVEDDEICNWYYSDENEVWSASCGYEFALDSGTPTENDMHFCPHCGGVLKEEVSH